MLISSAFQDDELLSVNQTTINRLIMVVALTVWGGILAADAFLAHISIELLLVFISTELFCWLCWFLNHRSPRVVPIMMAGGALLIISYTALVFRDPVVFTLFVGLAFVTASFISLALASLITLASCLVIIALGESVLAQHQMWLLVFSTIAGLFLSTTMSRTNRALLERIRGYQRYAVEQLEASRDSRGELAKAVKAMTEAEDRLRHLNAQLRYARSAAEEARRLKVQFATNVSHELRTPINLIVGFSEIIAVAPEIYGVALAPNYRADIQAIYRNAKHLQNLINDILDIAQVESGQLSIIKEETDPTTIFNEAIAMTRDLVESKGLKLHVELPSHLPPMLMDRTRVRQVLLNLLVNAARFTSEGSITVRAVIDGDHLLVSVIDTGIGITEQHIERVFDEFYQVQGSTARWQSGTGLGLALSKQFITQHGGRMWAESQGKAGFGSKFSFTLPLRDTLVPVLSATAEKFRDSEETRRVVVFDRDPAIVQLFKGYTQRHRVLGSHNLADIRAILSSGRIHTFMVADENGILEVRDLVDTHCPSATIITCPVPSGKRLVRALGVTDYLVKPVTRQTLLEALDKIKAPIEDILIMDDDRDMVRMYRRMLQAANRGYRLRQSFNGVEGLAAMREKRPDLVILDIVMPGADGYTVIQMINASPDLHGIPVVVVSARGAGETITEFARGDIVISHPTGYKPIELVRLIEAVVNAINIPTETAP